MEKVVLVSTGQPSTNPRLVKEADALTAEGYYVTVLYCYVVDWAIYSDEQILKNVKWNYKLIGGSPHYNKLLYNFTRGRNKFAKLINYKKCSLFAEWTQARAYKELISSVKSLKADLYIGHNLGALPVVIKAARYHRAKSGFDFEDYHLGEYSPCDQARRRVRSLENKYIYQLDYFSSSSPLITKAVGCDHPGFKGRKLTLLNCFPVNKASEFHNLINDSVSLRLFWFSQTVGRNRGLETILRALKQLNNPAISLTLVGRCSKETEVSLQELAGPAASQVFYTGIILPDQLPEFAGRYDIGLASEISFPANRDICLTNKIFTYISSGLCILASDTSAQTDLLNKYPSIGFVYRKDDPSDLARLIQNLFHDKKTLNSCKHASKLLGETSLNWENESRKFLRLVKEL